MGASSKCQLLVPVLAASPRCKFLVPVPGASFWGLSQLPSQFAIPAAVPVTSRSCQSLIHCQSQSPIPIVCPSCPSCPSCPHCPHFPCCPSPSDSPSSNPSPNPRSIYNYNILTLFNNEQHYFATYKNICFFLLKNVALLIRGSQAKI